MTATVHQPFTVEQYLRYDDGEGNHYELVDGRLVLMNPPTVLHFLITKFLETALDQEIQRLHQPWLTLREAGVQINEQKARLMDVGVVTQAQAQDLLHSSAVFRSPPLLIIEVVSPDSIKRDYRYKRSEYAAIGVLEYWIVDPLEHQITVLLWDEGFYEATRFTGEQRICSTLFPEIQLFVNQVLAAGNL